MTVYPKGILVFIGFIAALVLAWNANEGNIPPAFGMIGAAAILLVDVVLVLWPFVSNGGRGSSRA